MDTVHDAGYGILETGYPMNSVPRVLILKRELR